MGVSTDGQICFGVVCEEGTEFPWDEKPWDGDIDEWWRMEVCKYHPEVEIYDESGHYIDGKEPSQSVIEDYFSAQRAFDKEHPLPVELVNYCSEDCPMYILAVSPTVMNCRRGYPLSFKPESLTVATFDVAALLQFCETYGIEHGEPGWWLSSYWG